MGTGYARTPSVSINLPKVQASGEIHNLITAPTLFTSLQTDLAHSH